MSTHIIDRIAAVKFPKERTKYACDYYIVAYEGGDNNVISNRTNQRARDWIAFSAGQHYEGISRACEYAAACEGGCLKMATGYIKPENLIKRFRAALDAALDYDHLDAPFVVVDTAITFTPEEKVAGANPGKTCYYYDRLAGKRPPPVLRQNVYLRGTVEAFEFNFKEPREAAIFIEHLPHKSPLWHHLKISGRRELF